MGFGFAATGSRSAKHLRAVVWPHYDESIISPAWRPDRRIMVCMKRAFIHRLGWTTPPSSANALSMIHYLCDRCRCTIDPTCQTRHVVQIQIESIAEAPGVLDDEVDQLAELHLELQSEIAGDRGEVDPGKLEDAGRPADVQIHHSKKRFDLCESCHRAWSDNPIGQSALATLGFSPN